MRLPDSEQLLLLSEVIAFAAVAMATTKFPELYTPSPPMTKHISGDKLYRSNNFSLIVQSGPINNVFDISWLTQQQPLAV